MSPTFVLVHGAWHGAWCWEQLVHELTERGIETIAVDLPCDDPDAGLPEYADTVLEAAREREEVVLVGHSLGGFTIPLVAAQRPVQALVFVCALVPVPGLSVSAQSEQEPAMFAPGFGEGLQRDELDRSYWADPEQAVATLYPDVGTEAAAAALGRLRPQAARANREAPPLELWPAVRSVSIFAREDRAISPDWSRRVARERLGTDAIELEGGHSPFLSRPAALADALLSAL